MTLQPVLPDYRGGCITNLVPALLAGGSEAPAWMPAPAVEAEQVVLLVLDGLGWEQLQDRLHLAPTLAAMQGGAITTVAPSTTATALTSIVTGLTPGEHGVVGYRIDTDDGVLNVLRWRVGHYDARGSVPPLTFQPIEPFLGQRPPVVSKAEFTGSGFTDAHLDGVRFHPWRVVSTLTTEVAMLAKAGEPFIYAYYEGLDKVAHEYGLGEHYDAEIRFVDDIVNTILESLPSGAALVVTADHGQVHVDRPGIVLDNELVDMLDGQSGEARFRWLHAKPGRAGDVLDASKALYDDVGWACPIAQVLDENWFGHAVSDSARSRLGDVALLAREPIAFLDEADSGPYTLIGRHGSLTAAEMYVPLLGATAK